MPLPIVEQAGVEWDSVPLTLYLGRRLSESEENDLRRLADEWYADGSTGAFGGPLHSMDDIGFNEDEPGRPTAEWWVDMGDADEVAVSELVRRLEAFSTRARVPFHKLVLGTLVVE